MKRPAGAAVKGYARAPPAASRPMMGESSLSIGEAVVGVLNISDVYGFMVGYSGCSSQGCTVAASSLDFGRIWSGSGIMLRSVALAGVAVILKGRLDAGDSCGETAGSLACGSACWYCGAGLDAYCCCCLGPAAGGVNGAGGSGGSRFSNLLSLL